MDQSTLAYTQAQARAHGYHYPQPHQYPQYQQYQPQAWGNYYQAQGWNQYRGSPGYGGMPMGRGRGMPGYMQQQHAAAQQHMAHRQAMIVQVGEGTTVAGQSTESFQGKPELKLCYQCCKNIPLQTLMKTRDTSCNEDTCKRTKDADIAFTPMPTKAVSSCDAFQIFLQWWMDKVDFKVDAMIEKRARARLLEVRDEIPEATAAPRRRSK